MGLKAGVSHRGDSLLSHFIFLWTLLKKKKKIQDYFMNIMLK